MMIEKEKRRWQKITVLLILALTCSLMMAGRAAADKNEGRFDIVCRSGDGYYIPGNAKNYPVQIEVYNCGGDFQGIIKLMLYSGTSTGTTVAYVQPASIKAGEQAIFKFSLNNIYLDTPAYRIPVRVDLLDKNGNSVFSQAFDFEVASDGSSVICAGIISENTQLGQLMDASVFEYETSYVLGKVTMRGVNLTSDAIEDMDLSRLNMMLMDKNVTDEAWKKISFWLMKGGHLLMERSLYQERIGKTLDGQGMSAWGTGRILVYDETAWSGTELIQAVRQVFGSAGMERLMNGYNAAYPYWMADSVVSFDMWSEAPEIGRYFIVLLIYILLAGPAVYMVLKRKKDRREYMWGIIPCLAVIFSVIVYQFAGTTRYKDAFVRSNSIVQVTDEGTIENTSMEVICPSRGHTVATLTGQADILPLSNDYYWGEELNLEERQEKLMQEDYDMAVSTSGEEKDIIFCSQSVFDKAYFSVSRVCSNSGTLESGLQYYRGAFEGEIKNGTPWNLKNCFIVYKGLFLMIGDLSSGATVFLEQAIPDQWLNYSSSALFDETVYGEDRNQAAAVNLMDCMLSNSGLIDDREQIVIAGFTEDYDIGIEKGSTLESAEGLALIIQSVPIMSEGEGWTSWLISKGTGETAEDRDKFDPQTGLIYSDEPICLTYQLNSEWQPDYIRWINNSKNMHLEFYNCKTSAYEKVFESSNEMRGDMFSDYLSQSGQFKVRVKVDDLSENVYTPIFDMTGGEKHD